MQLLLLVTHLSFVIGFFIVPHLVSGFFFSAFSFLRSLFGASM